MTHTHAPNMVPGECVVHAPNTIVSLSPMCMGPIIIMPIEPEPPISDRPAAMTAAFRLPLLKRE